MLSGYFIVIGREAVLRLGVGGHDDHAQRMLNFGFGFPLNFSEKLTVPAALALNIC